MPILSEEAFQIGSCRNNIRAMQYYFHVAREYTSLWNQVYLAHNSKDKKS